MTKEEYEAMLQLEIPEERILEAQAARAARLKAGEEALEERDNEAAEAGVGCCKPSMLSPPPSADEQLERLRLAEERNTAEQIEYQRRGLARFELYEKRKKEREDAAASARAEKEKRTGEKEKPADDSPIP
jgi:hypothetical protein